MSRLIDVEKQLVRLYRLNLSCGDIIKAFLMTAPIVDAKPIRHGHWVDAYITGCDGLRYWYRECSECGYGRDDDNIDKDTMYCPNCGAKMDEVKNED